MTSSRTAQGLASLGRNGDTMLMHVSPSEVGGLKKVGDSLGIKMTTNPYTGMPEAFNFGDFFTSFLPTIAGIAAAPATGGFSMASYCQSYFLLLTGQLKQAYICWNKLSKRSAFKITRYH